MHAPDRTSRHARRDATAPAPRQEWRRSGVLLAVALALPVLVPAAGRLTSGWRPVVAGAVVLVLCACLLPLVVRGRAGARPPAGQLALQLSPVLLLTAAFPVATGRLAGVEVGGTPLTTLVLASSLTVPWLSQIGCQPLYRAMGDLSGGPDDVRRRFLAAWPAVLVRSLPMVLLFAVPVPLVLGWGARSALAYTVLCVLHLAFAQSLVVANVTRERGLWALAWVAYAVALLAAPALWFLPPLAALATQVRPLLRARGGDAHAQTGGIARDLVHGLLLGSVLWADKLFVFLTERDAFAVTMVFLALLPSVVAYNYFFVRLAPGFDRAVVEFRHAMEAEPYARLADRSLALQRRVEAGLARTALVAAVGVLAVVAVVAVAGPRDVALVAAVAVASWLFMMVTLLCYKLDYIGRERVSTAVAGAHLVLAALVLPLVDPLPVAYLLLGVGDLVVYAVSLTLCLRQWSSAEYSLFWRHAVAW